MMIHIAHMNPIKNLSETSLFSLADKFKNLRIQYGLSMGELSKKIEKDFGLKMSENLIGKIERKESKLQLSQFLAYCFIFHVELKDLAPDYYKFNLDSQNRVMKEYSRNPDFQTIVDLLLLRIDEFSMIVYIKNFIKNTFQLYESKSSSSVLKASSPSLSKRKKSQT
jgi:transcriptional regulator with XRE-family HTH domain